MANLVVTHSCGSRRKATSQEWWGQWIKTTAPSPVRADVHSHAAMQLDLSQWQEGLGVSAQSSWHCSFQTPSSQTALPDKDIPPGGLLVQARWTQSSLPIYFKGGKKSTQRRSPATPSPDQQQVVPINICSSQVNVCSSHHHTTTSAQTHLGHTATPRNLFWTNIRFQVVWFGPN